MCYPPAAKVGFFRDNCHASNLFALQGPFLGYFQKLSISSAAFLPKTLLLLSHQILYLYILQYLSCFCTRTINIFSYAIFLSIISLWLRNSLRSCKICRKKKAIPKGWLRQYASKDSIPGAR